MLLVLSVVALAAPALAAEPAPTQMAPALQQQLDALGKDVQGLRDALKAPGVTDAQRTMLEQHVTRIEQHVQMMRSGCCVGGQTNCPCAGDPSKCPGMQGGICPHMGMGPGMGMGRRMGPGPRRTQ
jgi:hypothetical protein